MAAALVLGRGIAGAARHTLVVQPVQVQRERTGHARVLTRAATRPAALVARLAGLRRRVVKLRSQTLHAEAAVQHKVRRAGRAGQRTGG